MMQCILKFADIVVVVICFAQTNIKIHAELLLLLHDITISSAKTAESWLERGKGTVAIDRVQYTSCFSPSPIVNSQ